MREIYSPSAIKSAFMAENEHSKSVNPYMCLASDRETWKSEFGVDSLIYQKTCEGVLYCLSRAAMRQAKNFNELCDIQKLIDEKSTTESVVNIAAFVNGYVIAMSYIHEISQSQRFSEASICNAALELKHHFMQPSNYLG